MCFYLLRYFRMKPWYAEGGIFQHIPWDMHTVLLLLVVTSRVLCGFVWFLPMFFTVVLWSHHESLVDLWGLFTHIFQGCFMWTGTILCDLSQVTAAHFRIGHTLISYISSVNAHWSNEMQRPGGHVNIKMSSNHYRIPMLKIKQSLDRLIFNMEIPVPGKDGLYIETGPYNITGN